MQRRTHPKDQPSLKELAAAILDFPMLDPDTGKETIFQTYLKKSIDNASAQWHKTLEDAKKFAKDHEFPEADPDFGPIAKLTAPDGADLRIGLNSDSYLRWLNRLEHLANGRPRRPLDIMFAERTDMMLAELRAPGVLKIQLAESHLAQGTSERTAMAEHEVQNDIAHEMKAVSGTEAYNASQLEKMHPLFEKLAHALGTDIGASSFRNKR